MKYVAASFLATFVACLLFLFGVDHLFCRKEPHTPQVDAQAFNRVVEENRELRDRWWKLRQEHAETLTDAKTIAIQAARAIEDAGENCRRAKLAEQRLAHAEQQVATLKGLLDARRREETRVPRLGDEDGERIPPQNLPLP